MKYANNIAAIDELSASEGVFTTAQAQRLGISRNALSHACKVGRLERVAHGAYRLSGAPSSETDELAAIWKLTASTAFSWERQAKWDGVAVGGSTAAWLLGIGDFHLSPYLSLIHIYKYADKFDKISLGDPLLTSDDDYKKVAAAIKENMASFDDGKKMCIRDRRHAVSAREAPILPWTRKARGEIRR